MILKLNIIFFSVALVLSGENAHGQNLDTITDDLQPPAVLDILSNRPVKRKPLEQQSKVQPVSKKQKNNVRRKLVTQKAVQEKGVIIRAISQFAPTDQFNVSAFKELTYEISDFTSQNIELPGVLGERTRNGDGTVELVKTKTLVRLEIDTAGIEGDIDFFERLVYNTLDLNLDEDDVTVKIWEFPYSAARKAKKSRPEVDSNLNVTPVAAEVLEEEKTFLERYYGYLIAVLALVLGVIIFLIIKRKKKDVDSEDLKIGNSEFNKMSLSALDKAPISMKKGEFKKLLIEAPEAVAIFTENLVETNQDEALTIFSDLSRPYPDLIAQLKPFMSYSSFLLLLNKVDEQLEDKIDPDSQDKFLLTFNNTVKALSNEKTSVEKTPDHKVFGFLTQLNDIQVFKLIEGDRPELTSVLFAQLPDERKLTVMSYLDDLERGEMLLKLTDMSRLPLSVIREIAQRYAKKAKDLAGLYNIDIDGIGAIINTLDELEENKQKEILETMLQNDLNKGQIVEEKFIGFFNIHKLDVGILENAFMDMETDILLNALFGADELTVNAILNTRPPREQEMIKSELESGNTVSSIVRSKARKEILTNIRKFV